MSPYSTHVGVITPSSWSVPVAAQVSTSPIASPVGAEILATLVKVGVVLSTVTETLFVALPPLVSAMTTVHCTTSFGEVSLVVS